MASLKTTQETTRSPITGVELVRLATPAANWKATLSSIASYISSTIISGVSSVAGKTGAVSLVQADVAGLTVTDFPSFKGVAHNAERQTSSTFAQLPAASSCSGAVARISDSPVTNLHTIVSVGAGSNDILVQSDGTNWRVYGPGKGGRRLACNNLTLYVATTGNDTTGNGTALNVRALYQRCPHLGCKPNPCLKNFWLECPCHGSRYDRLGIKADGPQFGPAPRGMDRFS